MAIGSGGLFGVGYGNSILKHCYVSEPANDMIFAILCEELGLMGAILVIILFAFLILRGFKIAMTSNDTFSKFLVVGICIKLAVQVLLNIAVVTNTIPNTGISLPFFSYGGSSLIMLFFEMGIILSISRNSKISK
jgi:cell division protein FtsW